MSKLLPAATATAGTHIAMAFVEEMGAMAVTQTLATSGIDMQLDTLLYVPALRLELFR